MLIMKSRIFNRIKGIYGRHKGSISIIFLLVIFVLFLLYMKDRKDDFGLLLGLSFNDIFLLLAGALLFKLILGYNFRVLISFFGINLGFRQWFGLTCMAAMANYLLPVKAGVAAQAVYLKKIYGFRYTDFLSSITGFYAVTFLVNAVSGVALSFLLFRRGVESAGMILIFFLLFTVVTGVFLFFLYHSTKLSHKLSFVKGFLEGLKNFHGKPRRAFYLVISQIGVIIAIGVRLLIAFRVLGIEIDIVSCMVIALITSFSIFVSVTPGNLGIKEFLVTFSASALGFTPSEGLMVAMLDRGVDIIVSFVTGYGFTYMLANKKAVPQDT